MRQITHIVLQTEEIQPCYRLAPTKTATWSWKHRKQRGDHHTGRVSFPLSCKIGSKKREMMEMRKTPKLHLFCYLDCYLENCKWNWQTGPSIMPWWNTPAFKPWLRTVGLPAWRSGPPAASEVLAWEKSPIAFPDRIPNWFNHTNYHIFLIATNY